ncbi:MAG: right-handed parallel beta-helix repeat-containing protein, partial [Anaerolineaceae bacterium]|nr:right-handed parallel beta-helix repeat-containing protein [Anaerolineaceae bacterium]
LLDANFNSNDGYGLWVNAGGAITWTTGYANGNTGGAGAYLKNDFVIPAAVTLTSVKTENNALDGIQIISKGFVTIIGELSAANNGGDGYDINNTGGYGVTLVAYTSWTDGNAGYGFQAISNGAISLTGLTAWNNGLGCRLDNSGGVGGGVTLVNSICQANTPGSTNLTVLSKGVIILVNVDARDNLQGNGALLDNSSATYPLGVTVSTGNFWNNKGDGLRIHSKGFVNLLYVSTWDNQGDGIYIDNTNGYGISILNNSRQFNGNNQGYGLFAQTNGPVTVNGANFWYNLKGSYIGNTSGFAGVTLLYSGFDSSDSSPAVFPGLTINTNGAVYLLKVETGSSADGGMVINNASSSYYAGVTIISSDFFNTGGTGLTINSRGFITINQVIANNNAGDGVRINNIGGYGVYIVNTNGWWNNNQGYAAYIESSGAVTAYSIFGSGSRQGIYIDNSYGTAAPVTLVDLYSTATQLGMTALDVRSKGYITLLNSSILDSQGAGAVLNNASSPYKYGMTVSGSTFRNNNGYGLSINSLGVVTVINVASSRNYGISGYGLYLSSPENTLPVTILNGVFNNNSQDGIYVDTKGIITILNGEANNNGGQGVQAMNDLASGAMPVIITGFRANLNAYHGILVFSKGAISLTSVTSLANGMVADTAGAYLKSNGSPVYVYYSAFNGNGKQGLHVDTRGGSGAFVNVLNTYAGNDVAGGTKDVNLFWEH